MNVYRRLSRWYRDKPRHAKACDSRRSLTRRADAHDLALYDIVILTDAAGWPSCGFALSTDHYRRVPALGRGWLVALYMSRFRGQRGRVHCMSPLLAQSGHAILHRTCPLSGVKRTWLIGAHMSACDPKRTSLDARDYIELDEHAQFIVATACARARVGGFHLSFTQAASGKPRFPVSTTAAASWP